MKESQEATEEGRKARAGAGQMILAMATADSVTHTVSGRGVCNPAETKMCADWPTSPLFQYDQGLSFPVPSDPAVISSFYRH